MLANSYKQFLAARDAFLRGGAPSADEFNKFDTPSTVFFRLFFYFGDGNLLDLSINPEMLNNNYTPTASFANTAYNFLLTNDELERAEYLKNFVQLLSNINTYSPWYFSKITQLGDSIARKEFADRAGLKIEEERRKIAIETLPDPYDNRIGTLLDLYRSACYSWQLKMEIVPANLRKFDMGILIFNTPIANYAFPNGTDKDFTQLNYTEGNNIYTTGSKYIELINCEINPFADTGYNEVDNQKGTQPVHGIIIEFDTVNEQRYNEFTGELITDIIDYDTHAMRNAIESKYFAYDSTTDMPGVTLNLSDKNTQKTKNEQRATPANYTEADSNTAAEFTGNRYGNKSRTLADEEDINKEIRRPDPSFIQKMLGDDNEHTLTGRLSRDLTRKIYFGNLADVTSLSRVVDASNTIKTNPLGTAISTINQAAGSDGMSIAGFSYRENAGWKKRNIEGLKGNPTLK